MAAMAKEKERKRPDKTFEEDGPSKEGLEKDRGTDKR